METLQQSEEKDLSYTVDNFKACMVLAAVGDIIGYKNDSWEFQKSSSIIHKEFNEMTDNKGVKILSLNMSWRYSDDTVMHMATARGLLFSKNRDLKFWQHMAEQYKKTCKLMTGRAPGKTCMK